jgi:DNA-binding PadR family transcriptional regulator
MAPHPGVSSTRLLVLGAVFIMQPAHGYLVMRELGTWKVDEWANLKPGSIYNALRSLTKAGLLTESQEGERGAGGKAVYHLTADGRTELETLVREALWRIDPWDPAVLMAGVSFWWMLSRQEVLDALEARRTQILAWLSANRYAEDGVARNPTTPSHVAEHFKLAGHRMQGELAWTEEVARRVKDGEYGFRGETLDKVVAPGVQALLEEGRPVARPE